MTARIAYTYRRVSTGKQAEEGVSLDDQRDQLEAYCKVKGWEHGGDFADEGRSGRTLKRRPGLDQAMKAACDCGGVLIVKALDRLTRSTGDADAIAKRFQKAKADLVIIDLSVDTSTPHGECIFNIIAALAQLESRRTGERIKATHAHFKKKNGHTVMGRCPFGWTWDAESKRRVEVPLQQAILADIRDLLASGYSNRAAAEQLNALGIPSPKGGKWWGSSVARVLRQAKANCSQARTF